jgi:hypothetical protein
MMVAARVMYLMSGALVLASGVCIEMRFGAQLSEILRSSILFVAMAYFALQLWRFLILNLRIGKPVAHGQNVRKLGLDFVRQ